MFNLLHPFQVFRAVYYGLRWRSKRFLRIPDKPHNPVVGGDTTMAFDRHLRICHLVSPILDEINFVNRTVACEIGPGDCLATADLFLGSGFERVYLVEKTPIFVNERQYQHLKRLTQIDGLPNKLDALVGDSQPQINQTRVRVVANYFETATIPEKVDFLFSHDVIEHVEDLPGFFSACARSLAPGGVMVHKIDLSGHEFFEDPLPPLDFQTYPNWLYDLMFPKYRRACRWFLDEILKTAQDAGFSAPSITLIRSAEYQYMQQIYPFLRKEARARTISQLAPLDVVVTATRDAI